MNTQQTRRQKLMFIGIVISMLVAACAIGVQAPSLIHASDEGADQVTISIVLQDYDQELPTLRAGIDFTLGQAAQYEPRFMEDEQGNQPLANLIEQKERAGFQLVWRTETGDLFDWFETPVNESLTVYGTFEQATYQITVSFNDGTTEDLDISISPGQSFVDAYGSIPDAPSKQGHSFVRWVDASNNTTFDFTAAVQASTTVYALYEITEPNVIETVDVDLDIPKTLTGRCYIGATWNVHPAKFSLSKFTGGLSGLSGTGTCKLSSAAAPSYTWADYTATLSEINVEDGYVIYDVIITPPGAAQENGPRNSLGLIGYQTVYFEATIQKNFGGYLEIQKSSANPSLSDGLATYSLEGAIFGIYDKNNNRVDELTTDSSGKTNRSTLLPVGTYTIKEEQTPQGYADTSDTKATIQAGSVSTSTIADIPQSASIDLLLQKYDAETKQPVALGSATLKGAQFRISYYDYLPALSSLTNAAVNQIANDASSESEAVLLDPSIIDSLGNAKRSWLFETDASGRISFTADYLVEGDEFYYDHNNAIVLPLGCIVIEEVQAPEGYLPLEDPIVVALLEEGTDTHVTPWATIDIDEQVKRGDLSFSKVREKSMDRLDQVRFSITSQTTGESHVIVTDENGMASTASSWTPHSRNTNQGSSSDDGIWFGEDTQGNSAPVDDSLGALPYDTYTIEELPSEANEDMILVKFEVVISRDNVTLDLGTIDNTPQTPNISGEVDKRQTLIDNEGVFSYTIDYRSTSSTWADEFTTTDTLICAQEGLAHLVTLTTPVSFEDYDGLMNVWYRTNLDESRSSTSTDTNDATTQTADHTEINACATNPYNPDNPNNERMVNFEGWHIWQQNISTLESQTLAVEDLSLEEGEWIVAIAFEHGRVEQGFGTRAQDASEWQREDRYTEYDTVEYVDAHEYTFDTAQATGATKTEGPHAINYAPAILYMQATEKALEEGIDFYNSAAIDIYRNLELHDKDTDTVVQTLDFSDTSPNTPDTQSNVKLPQTGETILGLIAALIALGTAIIGVVAAKRLTSNHEDIHM